MKQDLKHYFKIGGILCAIGAASALLIGGTNVITSQAIAQFEKEKEEAALKEVFADSEGNIPSDIITGDKLFIESTDEAYKHILNYRNITSSEEDKDEKYGYVFKTEGADKNNYGTITMLVAINNDYSIGKINILTNTESYASTVQTEYVDKYNKGEIDLEDTACGATFGATIIKEMAESAAKYVKEVL